MAVEGYSKGMETVRGHGRRPQGSPPIHVIHPRLYYDYEAACQARSFLVEAGAGLSGVGTLAVAFQPFSPVSNPKNVEVRG